MSFHLAWPPSSPTRSTPCWAASATPAPPLLIVEQHMGHALALCDRAVLLDHGAISWEGPTDEAAEAIGTALFDTGGS